MRDESSGMTTPPTGDLDDTPTPVEVDGSGELTRSAPLPPAQPKGLAIAAFAIGIAAFVFGWVPLLGIVLGVVAVVLGVIALVKRRPKVFAIIGLVLGALGLVTSIAMTAIGFWALANYDTIASSLTAPEPVQSAPAPVVTTPSVTDEPAVAPSVDLASFADVDDATFAAIIADADAHLGQDLLLYGEVAQFDDTTGACSLLLAADNSPQTSWDAYVEPALLFAASGETVCPEFAGMAEFAHVKAWVSVDGAYTLDFEDGARTVPGFVVHQVEYLSALE